jgi:hypothetical protein
MNQEPRKTLLGVFDDRLEAERALRDLEAVGFDNDQLGFAIRGSDAVAGGMITDTPGAKDARGAVAGAVTGAAVGGILAAAGTLLIPGVGPVLAGGLLTTILGYAAAGTAVGGILGALTGLEISEEEARYYEIHFREGKALLAVKAGDRCEEAARIMRAHGGYDLQSTSVSPVPTTGMFSQP